jgi:methyl-accepting chemotaxis protein
MKNKKLFWGIAVLSGTCVLMILSSVVQIEAGASGEGGARFFLYRVSAANVVMAAAGMGLLLAGLLRLGKKLKTLEDLVKPLAENDYQALEKAKAQKDGPYGALEKSLLSLGKFYGNLRAFMERSAAAREFLKNANREREAASAHTNEALEALSARFGEIEASADQAAGTIQQLESYFNSLKDAALEQSAFVEKAESRLSETAELASSVAGRLGEKEAEAEGLRSQVTTGEEQSRTARDSIRSAAQDLEKITEMTAAINQISEQTNILSMNAAIESAHAGSAGAGFAVVASEIKKLAESTRKNAQNIQEAIKAIARQINEALMASDRASETFGSITGGIKDFTESLSSINETANETAQRSSAVSGEIGAAVKESVSIIRKRKDSGADIAAGCQSFRSLLEQIHLLTGRSRVALREIQTGTQEVLENIVNTQEKVRETLGETGALGKALQGEVPAGGEPGLTHQSALPAAPASVPELSAPKPVIAPAPSRPGPARIPESGHVSPTEAQGRGAREVPRLPEKSPGAIEVDNSWRKDVAVKSPPQTIC